MDLVCKEEPGKSPEMMGGELASWVGAEEAARRGADLVVSAGFISSSSSRRGGGFCFCTGHKRHRGGSLQHQQTCWRGKTWAQAMEPSILRPSHPGAVLLEGLGALSPGGTETAKLLKAVLGHLPSAGPLQLWVTPLLPSFHPTINPLVEVSHPDSPRDHIFPRAHCNTELSLRCM